MTKKDQFVLSSSEFPDIKSAEEKVDQWQREGSLRDHKTRLYKVSEIYELKLKFVKKENKND